MTLYIRKQIRFIVLVVLISSVLGSLFALIVVAGGDSFGNRSVLLRYLLLGFLTGFFVSLALFLQEILFTRIFKNLSILFAIVIHPVISSLTIAVIYGLLYFLLFPGNNFWKESILPQTILFSLAMTFVVNLFQAINRLLGQNTLFRLFFGLYHKPVREERFFMFLDMIGSTGIAEKIGDVLFHNLLRDFFFDITEPLLGCQAEIHKYVGDEVILTWKPEKGVKNVNALNVFFACRERINERADAYKKKYGLVPDFRAGLHFGSVMVGEMGTFKMEIAFLGDVMNTSSRIQSACTQYGVSFLVSGEALNRFDSLPEGYRSTKIGAFHLRGKERDLDLFSLEKDFSAR